MGVYTIVFIIVIYAPFFIIGFLSFTGPKGGVTFPVDYPLGWHWYKQLSKVPYLVSSLKTSLTLAIMTLITSTVLGLLTAMAFRRKFKGQNVVFYTVLLGLVVPGILVGLGTALTCQAVNYFPSWYVTGYGVHVVWTYPFCFIIMLAVFNRFDSSLEDAARNLGAREWRVFKTITFPLISLGTLSCALFGFTLSYDELTRSLLAMGFQRTLPVNVWAEVAVRIKPTWYAFGVLTTLFSFFVLILYALLFRFFSAKQKKGALAQEEVVSLNA